MSLASTHHLPARYISSAGTAVVTAMTKSAVTVPPKSSPFGLLGNTFLTAFSVPEIRCPTRRTGW